MLTAKEVIDFINKRVSYKPGYEVQAFSPSLPEAEVPYGTRLAVTIRMSLHVEDSRDPGFANKRLISTQRQLWNEIHNYDQLIHELRDFFHWWECHESDEWFKVDGQIVRDPHG